MATARIDQTFACDADTFWRVLFFDEAFNTKLFLEHLRFDGWKVTRFDETDDAIDRVIEVKPVTGPLPGPVKKLVGDNLGYSENGHFDKRTKRYRFEIVPNTLPDKVEISGEIFLDESSSGKVTRSLDLTVKCKLFGIGGLVEKRIIEDTRQSYAKSYDHMVRALADAG